MSAPLEAAGQGPAQNARRRVVVTGGGRGIGRAITERFLSAGDDVVVLQRSEPEASLFVAASAAGSTVTHAPIDLSSEESIAAAVHEVLRGGRVDVLVNNAGVQDRYPAEEFPLAAFDAVMDVNLRAVFQLSQALGASMLAAGGGKIVNLASLLSFQGGLRVPAYAASKGAVALLTKALCNEWAGRGVNVNAVAPGYVDTEMNAALQADAERREQISVRIPAGRWAKPEDIAGAVSFLASPEADYIHGVVLPVDGGWLAR
jgi:2-dehydro-3-deoxy-D-gluconate 5-dehydrogenase